MILVIIVIKTVFMGTPEFAVAPLEVLIKNTEVALVVTQPDKYVGRKKILTPSPVKVKAMENGIPVFQSPKIRLDYERVKDANPDLIVTCAYGQILPKEVLDIPRLGCINIHASLLPKYRGGAPIEHAIMNGEEETGITIMYMDERMDTGDMILSQKIPIESSDNIITMHEKLSHLGASLLESVLPSIINGTNTRVKQDDTLATYAPTIKREEEHIDFHKKGVEVFNQVRALYPRSYFLLNNEEIKVLDGYVGENTNMNIGSISLKKDAIGIACHDKIYYITKLKPFGKNTMNAKDYLNGISHEKLLNSKIG